MLPLFLMSDVYGYEHSSQHKLPQIQETRAGKTRAISECQAGPPPVPLSRHARTTQMEAGRYGNDHFFFTNLSPKKNIIFLTIFGYNPVNSKNLFCILFFFCININKRNTRFNYQEYRGLFKKT